MTIQDISKKEFSKSVLGYDCREVDSFLDAIMDRMMEYENEKKEILSALEYLLKELESSENRKKKNKKEVIEELNETPLEAEEQAGNPSNVSDMLKQIEASIEQEIHFSEDGQK